MNCQYILQNEIHEKFLKGLLTEDQKKEYESHLNSCESCRNTFEHEKALFDGIRLAGQHAMKLEIERQVEKLRDEQAGADWTLIFKVAAVLFFLVIMPGTLYFLNTDLFTKKTEMAPEKKVDRMTGVELEEAESEEEGMVMKDTDEEAGEQEVASRKEARKEETISTSRGKAENEELKDEIRLSKKTDDLKSIQDVLGSVEGTTGEKGVGGTGAIQSISKEVSPSTAPELGRERIATAAAKSKKVDTEKMERRTPAFRPQMSKMEVNKPAKEQKVTELSMETALDSESSKITVYRLLQTEPVMLQENYSDKTTDKGYIRKDGLNTLNFASGYKQIIANVAPPAGEPDKRNGKEPDKSFKVVLISKSSDLINMNWYPQFDVRPFQPDKIFIRQPDDSNLLINFDHEYVFKVDISKDTTEAVLLK